MAQQGVRRAPAGSLAFWREWGGALSDARCTEQLDRILAGAAHVLCEAMRTGSGLDELGVDVTEVGLADRSGGIIDGWTQKVVLVDASHPSDHRGFIIAHEVAHLLIGYAHRSTHLQIDQNLEERLCDEFADQVIKWIGA